MQHNPFLILKNVSIKSFNTYFFEDINFIINHGEQWAITGKDDSDCSNFLKIFSHKYTLAKGSIEYCFYNDYIQKNQPDDPLFNPHSLIAQVDQKHHFKNLSNTEEFYYQQRYNAHDAEDAPTVSEYLTAVHPSSQNSFWSLERIINIMELSQLLETHTIKLSNGETKRLLIAAALRKSPSLLLLDHPFTGLDVDMRKALNKTINEIIKSGITVIIATTPHEIPDAINHVAVLEEKKLTKKNPKNAFQAESLQPTLFQSFLHPDFPSLVSSNSGNSYATIANLDNVEVRYDNKLILNKISWNINQGEHWALLGPNGSGKTTLLSLINGDNPQSYANNIILFDRKRGSGESIWEIKEKIGFMSPELYQYFPSSFTCIKTVESGFYDTVGFYRKSNPHNASIALKWMEIFNIKEYKEQFFYNVPIDIQRLCLLARALVKNPPLLLFDEPCQGLNPFQISHFKLLIDMICKSKKTTLIYVTHYTEEIPSCVSKLLRLKNGKVVYKGAIVQEK